MDTKLLPLEKNESVLVVRVKQADLYPFENDHRLTPSTLNNMTGLRNLPNTIRCLLVDCESDAIEPKSSAAALRMLAQNSKIKIVFCPNRDLLLVTLAFLLWRKPNDMEQFVLKQYIPGNPVESQADKIVSQMKMNHVVDSVTRESVLRAIHLVMLKAFHRLSEPMQKCPRPLPVSSVLTSPSVSSLLSVGAPYKDAKRPRISSKTLRSFIRSYLPRCPAGLNTSAQARWLLKQYPAHPKPSLQAIYKRLCAEEARVPEHLKILEEFQQLKEGVVKEVSGLGTDDKNGILIKIQRMDELFNQLAKAA